MSKIAFALATFVATYYLASLIQTVFHRLIGHAPRIRRLYDVHVKGHHAQYARQMLSDRWIPTEQHITGYYAIPFIPMVCAAYCLLPGIYFLVHVCGLAFAIWWHIYLHRQYHIRGCLWERFAWFREKRHLHFVHHQFPRKNFAIVEYSWDLLFGTFDEGIPVVAKISQNQKEYNYENRIHRHERRSRAQRGTHEARPHLAGFCGPQPNHRVTAEPGPAHACRIDAGEV